MNEQNYEFLKEQLKYTGFSDVSQELKEMMEKGSPEFEIRHKSKIGNDTAEAVLSFKQSNKNDIYFFNKYELAVNSDKEFIADPQTIYINRDSSISLKEGYNLLSGRAVEKGFVSKDDKEYTAWLQIDFSEKDNNDNYKFRKYHENYGFDLEKVLAKYPIKELANDQDKEILIRSLKEGNLQSVTLEGKDHTVIMFIEANPQYKTVNIYNTNMKMLKLESIDQYRSVVESEKNKVELGNSADIKESFKKKRDGDTTLREKTPKQAGKRGLSI